MLKRPRGEVTLRARADRIDRLGDGSLVVLDYKTGTLPSEAALLDGSARFYLRRDIDTDGATLYRLFHEGLADQLRALHATSHDPGVSP